MQRIKRQRAQAVKHKEWGVFLKAKDAQKELFVDMLQFVIRRAGGLGLILAEIAGRRSDLGCAFRQNSAEFRRNLAKSHPPERNMNETSTGMCYNTILDILVHSGWCLSTRFPQVENARTYSK
jgi:hypothetical protein